MPKVGKKHFGYGKEGRKAAKIYAKKHGLKVKKKKNPGYYAEAQNEPPELEDAREKTKKLSDTKRNSVEISQKKEDYLNRPGEYRPSVIQQKIENIKNIFSRKKNDSNITDSTLNTYKNMAYILTEKDWIQGAVDPEHEGFCTPMTKPTCTPRRKALAKRFKKAARKGSWKGKV
jgi:hypothetical protein